MTYYHRGHHNPKHNPKSQARVMAPAKLEVLLHGVPDPDRRKELPLSEGAIEAKRLLAVAQQAYVNQQENQMADMKTALSKVISQWDTDAPDAPAPTEYKPDKRTTTGVSQATFDYVKRNPGKTKAVAIKELEQQGYKPTSTTTLLSSMIRQGHITLDAKGGLSAAIEHYTPVKYVPNDRVAKPVKVAKPARQQVNEDAPQGLAALYVPPTPAPAPIAPPTTAQQVLETLNVKEAYELYLALAKMFA